jgi:glycosyltransferase involved in cell wall biosynthesis
LIFPLLPHDSRKRQIIEDNGCGICINPDSVKELQQAIEYLDKNRREAQEMGKRGFELVTKRFNWSVEGKKLIEFYGELFSPSVGARMR